MKARFWNVFMDRASGRDTSRPGLTELLRFARNGDTVVGHSVDRLARNLDDLRALVQDLTRKGCGWSSSKRVWCPSGRTPPWPIPCLGNGVPVPPPDPAGVKAYPSNPAADASNSHGCLTESRLSAPRDSRGEQLLKVKLRAISIPKSARRAARQTRVREKQCRRL